MRARHVHRVTPEDVGSRVSVRRWLDPQRTKAGDVLGQLLAYTSGVLRIDGRDGVVEVHEDDVLASRTVPPPPAPRTRP
jgi:hypothetical protein